MGYQTLPSTLYGGYWVTLSFPKNNQDIGEIRIGSCITTGQDQ
jgi:hypothetical protein